MRFRIQTDGEKFRVRWAETTYEARTIGRDKVTENERYPYDFNNREHIEAFGNVPELYFTSRDEAVAWIREHYGTEAKIVREWRTV